VVNRRAGSNAQTRIRQAARCGTFDVQSDSKLRNLELKVTHEEPPLRPGKPPSLVSAGELANGPCQPHEAQHYHVTS